MLRREFHPEASLDIEEVWEYIARDSLDAADRVVAEIEAAIDRAITFPQLANFRPDLTARPLRFLHLYDYLVVYASNDERLVVIAVLHGRRDPETLATLLSSRQR